ncbi:hypothetical protein P691DRAFT_788115 [Macrolepiota fuliginosa MF-IS2]|uniref:Uncharacterized protein n=1 Tax=Macrolepiota fuliginosa MF-IS2 TaxID=1400762 RepID=A0A9P6C7B3_9AGAR|nr:hypothetical protein P691DRAFT_788115 [Macrolepiota fuliginosa MF-IS2]
MSSRFCETKKTHLRATLDPGRSLRGLFPLSLAPTDMSNKPSHHRRPKPPRFSQTAADILGYMPSYLPTSQLLYQSATMLPQTYERCPQWAQKAAEIYIPDSLPGAAETATGLPCTLFRFPETIPESDDRLPRLSPIERKRELSEAQGKFPQTKLPSYGLSPSPLPPPTIHTRPYNAVVQSPRVVHPAPCRPIQLPDILGPLLSSDSLERSFYLPTPVAGTLLQPRLGAPDYSYNIESTVHKDSHRFLLQKAAAAASSRSYCPPPTKRTGECNCNSVGVQTRASDLGAFDLDDYTELLRQQFSCSISQKWLEGVVRPDSRCVRPDLLTESEKALYQTRVRSWIAGNTGLTIYQEVCQAFAAIDVRDEQQCAMPFIWLVLLLRKALIMSPCARQFGILLCLGTQDLDPCHPSFRFSALKDAVRDFLGSVKAKSTSRGFYDVVCIQQRITDVCTEGHIHIVISQTPYSTFHPQPLRPRPYLWPDMVSYTNEFRENLKKLFADASAVEYIFLVLVPEIPAQYVLRGSKLLLRAFTSDPTTFVTSIVLDFHWCLIFGALHVLGDVMVYGTPKHWCARKPTRHPATSPTVVGLGGRLCMTWPVGRKSYTIKLLGLNGNTVTIPALATHTVTNNTKGTFEDLNLGRVLVWSFFSPYSLEKASLPLGVELASSAATPSPV